MPSAFRTVRWIPPAFVVAGTPDLHWPDKRPLDYLDYSLDLGLFIEDGGDTIATFTASTAGLGLQISAPAIIGSLCTMMLGGGFANTAYSIDLRVTMGSGAVLDVPVTMHCAAGLPAFSTSPVLLAAGITWFNAARNVFVPAPAWSSLPSTPATPDDFYLFNNAIMLPAASTYLATSPVRLALGDLWNNAGAVTTAGNPGLPLASLVPGTLLYSAAGLVLA